METPVPIYADITADIPVGGLLSWKSKLYQAVFSETFKYDQCPSCAFNGKRQFFCDDIRCIDLMRSDRRNIVFVKVKKTKEEKIDKMVDRFLRWELPENFVPDNGISFEKQNMNHRPTGTNLFTATQAREMIKYMMETK